MGWSLTVSCEQKSLLSGNEVITVNKLSIKLLLMAVLLFTMNCDEARVSAPNDVSGENYPLVTGIRIDYLCSYVKRGWVRLGERIFQDATHLTSFLDSTGYDEKDMMTIKMTHRPDFEKWVYFTIVGTDWGKRWRSISEERDTITIHYAKILPPLCDRPECPDFAPPPQIVTVSFIPFTRKTIIFKDTIERFKCGNINCSGNK
jgi:hypothetical protein